MDYTSLITKFVREHKFFKYSDLEASIITSILRDSNIRKVKNLKIAKLLRQQSDTLDSVYNWFFQNAVKPDLRVLEKFYELNIANDERKINGSYYTPENIVTHIINETTKGSVGTFCDPACGSGAFLVEAARFLKKNTKKNFREIYAEYIFGVDLLPSSKEHTETILTLLAILCGEDEKEFDFNIFTGDSLVFDWSKSLINFKGFDFIVSNPPYVRARNLDIGTRDNIKLWKTASTGMPDLYIPFFEMAINLASDSGRVGFITPSTYLTSRNAQELRGLLSSNGFVEKIIDFNGWQIFKGATTYTCISILSKKPQGKALFTLVSDKDLIDKLTELKYTKVDLSDFGRSEWRLLNSADAERIFKIEKAGTPLYKYVDKFVTGIATLNNDLFLINDNQSELLRKSYNGTDYFIERAFTKSIIKPNKVKDVAALKSNNERIIYPYVISSGRAVLIPERDIRNKYPQAYRYLLAIKKDLSMRDGGTRVYRAWYAYGRTQGISDFGKKIILPMMGNKPSFITVNEQDSLIYCGYAIFAKKETDFPILEKILNSELMWFYIKKTSKNYSGGFKSFAKSYVKNFSIPEFTQKERDKLLSLRDPGEISILLRQKYGISS